MNANEPVAWMDNYGNICLDIDKKMNQGKITARNNYDANDIPLYTHPAKTLDRELLDKTIIDQQNEIKELRKNLDIALMIVNEPAKTLTDEEIYEIAMEVQTGFLPQDDTLAFARAVLRKAHSND